MKIPEWVETKMTLLFLHRIKELSSFQMMDILVVSNLLDFFLNLKTNQKQKKKNQSSLGLRLLRICQKGESMRPVSAVLSKLLTERRKKPPWISIWKLVFIIWIQQWMGVSKSRCSLSRLMFLATMQLMLQEGKQPQDENLLQVGIDPTL